MLLMRQVCEGSKRAFTGLDKDCRTLLFTGGKESKGDDLSARLRCDKNVLACQQKRGARRAFGTTACCARDHCRHVQGRQGWRHFRGMRIWRHPEIVLQTDQRVQKAGYNAQPRYQSPLDRKSVV